MSFNSLENKELLLSLLSNNNVYLNYPNFFMKSFHDNIDSIQKKMSGKPLILMNKELIKNMSNIEKTTTQQPTQEKKLDKNEIFQQQLAAHEKNFSESINIKKPDEIDFSDNIEDGEIKDIDKTMQQREKELEQIMSSYNSDKATNWLSSKETRTPNLKIQEKNVKIETIDLEKKPKKVRFKNDGIENLFNKLKKNTEPNLFLEKNHEAYREQKGQKETQQNGGTRQGTSPEDIKKILFNQKIILEKLEKIEKNIICIIKCKKCHLFIKFYKLIIIILYIQWKGQKLRMKNLLDML